MQLPVCRSLVTCMLWLMACWQVMVAESFPPLVSTQERFEDIEALLANISIYSPITNIVFSPRGNTIASGGDNGTVHLWDIASGRELKRLEGQGSSWLLYTMLVGLAVGSSMGVYYLRLYRHPLVTRLSATPASLMTLPLDQLPQAQYLLQRTRRLHAILTANAILPAWLERAVTFARTHDPATRYRLFKECINATDGASVPVAGIPLFHATSSAPASGAGMALFSRGIVTSWEKAICPLPSVAGIDLFSFHMPDDFVLNVDRCLLAFPPGDMAPEQVLAYVQQVEETRDQTCLIISTAAPQQAALCQACSNQATWFVAPSSTELTTLLMSPAPQEALARLIASQVRVTRISPYQTGGGVNKDSVFFGRSQLLAHIIQRKPANYLVVGGRQLGKSTLLKALARRYQHDPRVECHYLLLYSAEISSHLAGALGLAPDATVDTVLAHMGQVQQGTRRLFLIDEADRFIEAEARQGYAMLHRFRSLSEAGRCQFILAGFWGLYRAATFDYQSPIRNFGETLTIGALEPEACYELATKPMQLLNIRYATETLVETLVQATGGRANLIAIICEVLLQHLEPQERVIQADALTHALESQAVRRALAGWGSLSNDEQANRLDRIIVYTTINRAPFTLADLAHLLEEQHYPTDLEQLKQSLDRLELAFILQRSGEHYTFCVPLFTRMIQAQEPQLSLQDELRRVHT